MVHASEPKPKLSKKDKRKWISVRVTVCRAGYTTADLDLGVAQGVGQPIEPRALRAEQEVHASRDGRPERSGLSRHIARL